MATNNEKLEDKIGNSGAENRRSNSRGRKKKSKVSIPSMPAANDNNYNTLEDNIDDSNVEYMDNYRDKNVSTRAALKGALGVAATVGALAFFQNSKYGQRLSEFMEFWNVLFKS